MSTCETYLADIKYAYEVAEWHLNFYLTNEKTWFQTEHTGHPWDEEWRDHVNNVVTEVENIVDLLIHTHHLSYHPHRLSYYLENCVGGGDITMADLLNAMLAADPDEVLYFVGVVDAYRQSVWNKPFNQEFYAALARGFM